MQLSALTFQYDSLQTPAIPSFYAKNKKPKINKAAPIFLRSFKLILSISYLFNTPARRHLATEVTDFHLKGH